MITHIIYHLPGIKVGCTQSLGDRKRYYPRHQIRMLKVLEELHEHSDQQAGDREWEWADHFGYKRGPHYTKTLEATRAPGSWAMMTPEKRIKVGKASGSLGGKARANKLTPQQLSEIARKGGQGRAARGLPSHLKLLTKEQHIESGRMGGSKGGPKGGFTSSRLRDTCPHCGLEGQRANLYRWHFDRCLERIGGRP
jgi:hypothetical protein